MFYKLITAWTCKLTLFQFTRFWHTRLVPIDYRQISLFFEFVHAEFPSLEILIFILIRVPQAPNANRRHFNDFILTLLKISIKVKSISVVFRKDFLHVHRSLSVENVQKFKDILCFEIETIHVFQNSNGFHSRLQRQHHVIFEWTTSFFPWHQYLLENLHIWPNAINEVKLPSVSFDSLVATFSALLVCDL